MTVQHLLLPNIKRWDIEKLNSLFSEEEVNRICVVPLLELVGEDKLIWDEEKDGLYSVRSGYRRIIKERDRGGGPRRVEDWCSIWKIKAPPKAKHMLWRICRECLTT
jgi:hypothetical protein